MISASPKIPAGGISMYKTLGFAVVLLLAFAFMSGSKSAGSSQITLTTPMIVASGKMLNQTAPFSKTLYTPGVSGLFRLSVYATITTADPTSTANWEYGFSWTDSTGAVQGAGTVLGAQDYQKGEFWDGAASGTNTVYLGGTNRTFQANAGTPITHFITCAGGPDNSAYSFYYTLERLE
jgi:hypothetical protein